MMSDIGMKLALDALSYASWWIFTFIALIVGIFFISLAAWVLKADRKNKNHEK